MKLATRTRALLVLVLASGCVHAQDTGKVVCGEPIALQAIFGGIKVDSAAPRATYAALKVALEQRAEQWPERIGDSVSGAYRDMLYAAFAPSDFRIEDVGTGLIQRQVAFPATTRQLELPKTAGDPSCATEKAALKEAAEFVILVQGVFGKFSAEQFAKAARQIEDLEKVYDRYLFEGFPLFPWEALANSALLTDKSIANGPPRDVLVLFHPAAGFVGSVGSDTQSDIGAVLSVEPFGWIRYSEDYDSWYGASLLAVLATDREVGYGVALNYRNFKLGVSYHDDNSGKYDGAAIFLGMDLYQFLGEQQRSYKAYFDKVKKLSVPP